MHGLDQGALAGAARTPEQGIVRGQALGETPRVVEQGIAGLIDAAQETELDPAHLGDGFQPRPVGVPDEGLGLVEGCGGRARRREALESVGDPLHQRQLVGVGHAKPSLAA